MTKTDFAELKEKLTEFDSKKNFDEIMKEAIGKNPHHKEVVLTFYAGSRNAGRNEQNTKSAAIISELIEIIKSQSVTIDSICTTHSDDCTDADEDFSEDETCECGYISIVNNKKETTTRLQKLRDGIENGK